MYIYTMTCTIHISHSKRISRDSLSSGEGNVLYIALQNRETNVESEHWICLEFTLFWSSALDIHLALLHDAKEHGVEDGMYLALIRQSEPSALERFTRWHHHTSQAHHT